MRKFFAVMRRTFFFFRDKTNTHTVQRPYAYYVLTYIRPIDIIRVEINGATDRRLVQKIS